jgi:branched-chain amino acid transport system substrate-binding protein
MSIRARFFLAILLALSMVGRPAAAQQVVKVGMILTLSGPFALLGEPIDRGARLYAKLHDEDLPGGITIAIIRRDDTGPSPDIAKRLAQELLTRDGVKILTGIVWTPTAAAIAPLATEAKTPLLLMNATTSSITRLSPFIVRVSYTQWQLAYEMGVWMPAHDLKTAYVAVTDIVSGADTAAAFDKGFTEHGGKIIGSVRTPIDTTDYAPYLQRIRDAKPQSLFMFVNVPTNAIKGYADIGLRGDGIPMTGPGTMMDDELLPQMGDAAVGALTAGNYSSSDTNPANAAFVGAYHQEYGAAATPNFLAVAGWDGMAAIYDLVKTTKGSFTPDQAMQFFATWKDPDSPRGPIAIDPATRDIVQNIYIHKVEKIDGKPMNVKIDTIPQVKDPWKEFHPG